MQDKFETIQCSSAVIALKYRQQNWAEPHDPMFRADELCQKVAATVIAHTEFRHRWFIHGIECELLELGATKWRKGKVRIKVSLEFCPDESEIETEISELDCVRQSVPK